MIDPLSFLYYSLATMLVLSILFRVEDARGKRFLETIRSLFDTVCGVIARSIRRTRVWFGAGMVRLFFHYLAHKLLKVGLAVMRTCERFFEKRLRYNRQKAHKLSESIEQSHLAAIAEHKRDTALTEREKQHLRAIR